MAREFDRGQTGPPMSYNVDFVANGLLGLVIGASSAIVLVGFAWWAPVVLLLAWGSTHWLLRESGVWKDRQTPEVRAAQRHADYAYGLAVDPQPAKELRMFGLAGWVIDRFRERRRELFELQYRATRLRERSVGLCLLIVGFANLAVFGALGWAAVSGDLSLEGLVIFVQVALGVSQVAFGGLNWALDGASAPVAAVERLEPAMAPLGALPRGPAAPPAAPRSGAPRRRLPLPRQRAAHLHRPRPHRARRHLARHRRPERRWQDHPGQAALPALRPRRRRYRGQRTGSA